jgi:hypothetical protein
MAKRKEWRAGFVLVTLVIASSFSPQMLGQEPPHKTQTRASSRFSR